MRDAEPSPNFLCGASSSLSSLLPHSLALNFRQDVGCERNQLRKWPVHLPHSCQPQFTYIALPHCKKAGKAGRSRASLWSWHLEVEVRGSRVQGWPGLREFLTHNPTKKVEKHVWLCPESKGKSAGGYMVRKNHEKLNIDWMEKYCWINCKSSNFYTMMIES